MLSWPLQRKRTPLPTILRTLATLSLVAWLIDSFYSYFLVTEYSSAPMLISFLLHILANVIFIIVLSSTMQEGEDRKRFVNIIIAVLSLCTGGGGFFLCPALLFFDMLLMERRGKKQRKYSSIVCKTV